MDEKEKTSYKNFDKFLENMNFEIVEKLVEEIRIEKILGVYIPYEERNKKGN